jgi:myosin protein heavy chain
LEDPKNYTFLTNGSVTIPCQDDGEEFQHTVEAMKVMGINDEDMCSIWKVISASLLFGNMVFKQERNSDQVFKSHRVIYVSFILVTIRDS